jgi:hypothetical protein
VIDELQHAHIAGDHYVHRVLYGGASVGRVLDLIHDERLKTAAPRVHRELSPFVGEYHLKVHVRH